MVIGIALYFRQFSGSLSMFKDDWTDFSSFLNGFTSPLLALVNILVLIALNLLVYKASQDNHKKQLQSEKGLIKLKLGYDKYLEFRNEIKICFENLMNVPMSNNQEVFDKFKSRLFEFLTDIEILYPNLHKTDVVEEWQREVKEIDGYYASKPNYDFCSSSNKLSTMLKKLLDTIEIEIVNS